MSWEGFITLRRSVASAKLTAARGATYYYQRDGGDVYKRDVTTQEMVASFEGNPKAKCRVRTSNSEHVVVLTDTKKLRTGYLVDFG